MNDVARNPPDRGRAAAFRRRGWLERAAAPLARVRPRGVVRVALQHAYRAVLAVLSPRMFAELPGGERVALSPDLRQVTWNPEEYVAFRATVRPGDVVLDVGANVGAYTVLFAKWAGARGQVFAFEPAPASVAALRRLIALNGGGAVVEVVPCAAGDRTGTAAFRAEGANGANALVPSGAHDPAALTVRMVTLDEFCASRGIRPRVIKLDVEGAEIDALHGARATLADPAVEVFVELHPAAWPARGLTRAAVAAELGALGFEPEPLVPGDPLGTEGVCVRLRRTGPCVS
jgi:FkbM family methyltransferase